MLVEYAETELRNKGRPKINLQIIASNSSVMEFYESLGFSVDNVLSMDKRLQNNFMATPEPILRPSTTADREFAFRVWKAAMEQYIDATWGWDDSVQRQRQQEEFAARTYQIIEVAGQSVGTCIVERQPDCFYLSGLYILPECQNRGIGSLVLKVLLSEGQAHKLPVRLRVLRVNPAAQRLYERNGFIVVDETEASFLIMEKSS